MIKKLTIAFLFILFLPLFSFAEPYSHIKLAFIHLHDLEEETQEWIGKHYSLAIISRPTTDDYTTMLSFNPNMIIVKYLASVGCYKPSLDYMGDWELFWQWMRDNGYGDNKEDLYLHYKYDKTWTELSLARYTTIFTPGGTQGIISGNDTRQASNRAIHFHWGSPVSGKWSVQSKEYVALSRSSNIVTATKTNHGFSAGWRLNVYVDAASDFSGDNFEILTVPNANTFTYAQSGENGVATAVYVRTMSSNISSISRSSNVVTVTINGHWFEQGDLVLISNCSTTSFNGEFLITGQTTNTFTYAQAGSNESASDGVATYFGWNYFSANPQYNYREQYMKLNHNTNLKDSAGNILNGYHFDNITGIPEASGDSPYFGDFESKNLEYLLEKGETYPAFRYWWSKYRNDGLVFLRDTDPGSVASFVSPKPAYNSMHSDGFRYAGRTFEESPTHGMHEFYQMSGPDIMFHEEYWYPSGIPYENLDQDIGWMKNCYDLMDIYGKKGMYVVKNSYSKYATHLWENYSGNIWYTDAYAKGKKMHPKALYTTGGILNTKAGSLVNIDAPGEFWYDQSTGRLYGWFTNNINPNDATYEFIQRYELSVFFSLSAFYIFGNHSNAYYFPYETGMGTSGSFICDKLLGNNDDYWYDALEYNVGSPVAGGLKVGGGYATDLWSESTQTSSKAYEMWRDPTYSTSRLYARKYTNGYAIVRFRRFSYSNSGELEQNFTMPFIFRKLRADNSLDDPTNQLTLAEGEGAFLITNYETPPTTESGLSSGGASFR